MVIAWSLVAGMEIAESPNLTDTSNSDSSEAESDSYDSETGGPPGLLPAGHVDDSELSEEDSGTTSDYGSREGEVEDDVLVEEDPEKIRKAGNDLFNAENIEGALEKYKEAIACGERGSQMSADSLSKTYSNIAHCYNKKKKYVESIEASFNSMEAKKDFVRPYLRVAHSYKMLGNLDMSALALIKAKAMPIMEQNPSTVQAIKAEIVRELAEVADEAKVAARDYMHRKGINNACKLDLQAARAARFGEKSKQLPPSSPPSSKTNNLGRRSLPQEGAQPGLCGTSDQEYSTSDVDDATTMSGSKPAPAPGKHAPPPPPLANGTFALSTSSEDEETRPTPQERKKKTKKTASKQEKLKEETQKKLEEKNKDDKMKEERMEKLKAAERERVEEEERKRKAAEKLKKEKEAKAEKLREEQEKQRRAEEEENRRKNERLRLSSAASQQLHLKLSEANSAFKNNTMERSLEQYSGALDIINSDWNQLGYRTSKESSVMVVVVKYQFARSCSETGLLKNLTTAHNVFTEILQGTHKEVKFPAVYLGFGMLYKRLNRHEQALKWVEKGVGYLEQGLPCPPSTWPGGSDRLPDTDEPLLRKALMALKQEMKCPPRPKAICKFRDCLRVQRQLYPDEPFIPSQNIYLTDPDLQCFITVVCRNDCKLDFHSPCWDEKKMDFLHVLKASKSPSERDFCGQPCFTPDCGSLIVKILITDGYNEVKVVDNKKILQEIEEEERKEKESERRQKELEEEERKRLKHQEKLKKLEKRNKERTPTSSEKEVVQAEKSESSNIPAQQFADPASFIPLDSATVTILNKKQRDVEPEEKVKKTKKSKEKAVLSLGEFNGDAHGDGPELHGDHQERLARLACIKRNVEQQEPLPPTHYSVSRTDLNPVNLKAQIDSYLGREPVSVESVVVESIKSDVLQKLKQLGPLKEEDQRLVVNLSQEGRRLVMDKKGMINFLKNDERFGSYADYVCLKGEAERAKQLHENEAEEKPKNNLGDLARKMRLELELGEKKKREQEAVNAKKDQEEKVVKDAEMAEEVANQQAVNFSPSQCQECQTDWDMAALHSLEGDPLALQRLNAKLSAEAQELKDKMYKLQNERKVEVNELSDKLRTLKVENNVMKEEVKESKAKVAKMEVAYKEGLKRDEELKKIKDSLVLKSGNLDSTQSQLNKAQQKLAKETELSFELQQKFHKEKERRENEVRLLKLKLLKDQHETINAHLLRRKAENEANMAYLSTIGADRVVKSSLLERLNEFSAKLIHAVDVLKSKYEEAVAGVNATTSAQFPARLDLDLVGLEAPTLTAQEADALRLLAMAGLASVGLTSTSARASPSPFPPTPLRAPPASGFPAPPQNNFPGPPPPIGLPGTPLLRPPPGMLRSAPTVADQLAAVAPQANVRPASTTMSRAPGGPVGTPRPPQPPIGTAPRAPAPVNLGSKAPGGPTVSATRPTSRGASGPSPSIPDPPAPVGGATASAAGPNRGGKKSSHEKLIEKLSTRYPQLSTDDLSRYINKLRERNSGKLSGMSVASIEQQVGALMVQFPPMNPPPQASASALADQDSNNCAVCLEEMFELNSKRLNPCGHRFHHHCINEWMHTHGGAGNTCPMCRVYITREDEFPDLGHNPHRRH